MVVVYGSWYLVGGKDAVQSMCSSRQCYESRVSLKTSLMQEEGSKIRLAVLMCSIGVMLSSGSRLRASAGEALSRMMAGIAAPCCNVDCLFVFQYPVRSC